MHSIIFWLDFQPNINQHKKIVELLKKINLTLILKSEVLVIAKKANQIESKNFKLITGWVYS